ncbi:MAG TPA: hypothetical protein VH328_00870 [Burkholderiaceae bacterium]|jgi:hypothetical protein|nr:hypothetical protein [Burkholderiaceae bacterium]
MPQTFSVGARSRFVTFVAWMFLALSALSCAWAVIQNATQASWAAELATHQPMLPGLGGLLLRELPWLLSAAAALSLATALCAVGLLRRLEWARRLFIALLGLAIMVDLAGLWLQQEMVHLLVESALRAPLPQGAASLLGGAVTTARVLAALLTLGASLALADIIRRLMSPAVRQEFA